MRRGLFCWLVVFGVLAVGCGGDDDETTRTDQTSPTTEIPLPPDPVQHKLIGRTFVSETVTENGQPKALVEGTRVVLTFREGDHMSADAGCNGMSGDVVIGADRLVVGELTSTLIGCPDGLGDQDEWLSAVLLAEPAYQLDGDRLRIEGNGSVIELVDREVAAPDQPLEGTVWKVDGTTAGDVASSVPSGLGATLVFGDGAVELQVDGCNQGSAPVTIGESEIEIGPLAMTKMGCPDDVAQFESTVLGVLDGTVTYETDASSLRLTNPNGAGLTLVAQP